MRLLVGLLCCATVAAGAPPDVAARRAAVLQAATQGAAGLPTLRAALDDESGLVRRAAVRALGELGQPAEDALRAALANTDYLVRRAALVALAGRLGPAALPLLDAALADERVEVRLSAVGFAVTLQPRDDAVLAFLQKAVKDPVVEVRRPAQAALWPFHKDVVLFRQRPDVVDVVTRVKTVATIPLTAEGWRFRTDQAETGHVAKWFDPALDEQAWKPIAIEQYWQKAGYEYTGVAWYRHTFNLPAKPDLSAVELACDAIDESAWVWLNGVYVGQHDLGPAGWDRPFALDVTDAVKWGAANQLTIRVLNTKAAGGIWKPVRLEVLQLD